MKVSIIGKYKYSKFFTYVFFPTCFILIINYYKSANDLRSVVVNFRFQMFDTQDWQGKRSHSLQKTDPITVKPKPMKYILQWTTSVSVPFVYMGVGQNTFIQNKCPHVNCFVTSNESYLGNIMKFDVVVFAGPDLLLLEPTFFPRARSPHQKYVFASIESAANYPMCMDKIDGYFNWTWTYKLDSDSRWGYIVIRAANGTVIGPNKVMHWRKREDMQQVPEKLRAILRGKTKTAAWYVSNCQTLSGREIYVNSLNRTLYNKYNLSVDIYGTCGKLQCPRNNESYCDELLRRDYFFYLAFENAFSDDYVTEKLLRPLQYNAVPIVFGGANYSRFLPDGSYIDASKKSPTVHEVAKKMYQLINNFEEYVEYFKWTNHYSYHRRSASIDTDDYCSMCALLNDENKVEETTVYQNFTKWWNGKFEKCK